MGNIKHNELRNINTNHSSNLIRIKYPCRCVDKKKGGQISRSNFNPIDLFSDKIQTQKEKMKSPQTIYR